jgi:hypothetical protein
MLRDVLPVAVRHGPLDPDPVAGDYVVVLDASTGAVITTVPTSLDIAFVG